ncbi:hypothetical protein BURCENK562V_C6275 [Burkholderia cenocepacia K56-2Valvano]|nr:hypothetical protein BURCENK562V_C6275 [Burkholderia cenocepacia K56-2Valvano]
MGRHREARGQATREGRPRDAGRGAGASACRARARVMRRVCLLVRLPRQIRPRRPGLSRFRGKPCI